MITIKHYQHKRHNPYILPHNVYYQTIWTIKGYYWMRERVDEIITASPSPDGQPKGSGVSDPTFAKAAKLGNFQHIVRVIDEEREAIQDEYRQGVWDNIQHGTRYPDDADRRTYSRHKSKFVYKVAERIGNI